MWSRCALRAAAGPARRLAVGAACIVAFSTASAPARAQANGRTAVAVTTQDESGPWQPNPTPPRMEEERDFFTRRLEPAGFPIFGGNSDIGFEIGAAGTLSYFSEGVRPYAWNMDASAALSFKGGPNGKIEIAQQLLQWNIDKPGLLDGRLRVNPQAIYS